jgi:hypothetical protein
MVSAAYAAAAAPSTRTAVTRRIVAAERQLGPLVLRLPGAPAPQCRHQSWALSIGAPQFAHLGGAGVDSGAGVDGGAPGVSVVGGCSGVASTGGSASVVFTDC